MADGRLVIVCEATAPALVLGSAQPVEVVDADVALANGLEVVRRRSGGGLVLVDPEAVTWIDVVIARDDPLWSDDVGVAGHWVGEVWAGVLRGHGRPAAVCVGPEPTEWSPLVCFAGRNHGEVVIDGAKAVGLSQRRTRGWARFQTMVVRSWDAELMAALVAADVRPEDRTGLDAVVAVEVPHERLVEDFRAELESRTG